MFVIGISRDFAHLTINQCSLLVYLEIRTPNHKSMFVVAGSPYNDSSTHVTVAPSFVQQNITITMGTCISPDSELTTELFLQFLCSFFNGFERES